MLGGEKWEKLFDVAEIWGRVRNEGRLGSAFDGGGLLLRREFEKMGGSCLGKKEIAWGSGDRLPGVYEYTRSTWTHHVLSRTLSSMQASTPHSRVCPLADRTWKYRIDTEQFHQVTFTLMQV